MLRRTFLRTPLVAGVFLTPGTIQPELPALTPAEHFILLDPIALVALKSRRRMGLRRLATALSAESRELLLKAVFERITHPGFVIDSHPALYILGGTTRYPNGESHTGWCASSGHNSISKRELHEGEIRPDVLRAWTDPYLDLPLVDPLRADEFWIDRFVALHDEFKMRRIRNYCIWSSKEQLLRLGDSLPAEQVQDILDQHFPLGKCSGRRIELVTVDQDLPFEIRFG